MSGGIVGMKEIETIIKNKGREQFYDYYRSLGYDHKVAASLSLFTYGEYRYRKFSFDELYEALCAGKEYIPREVLEELERRRKRREAQLREMASARNQGAGTASYPGETQSKNAGRQSFFKSVFGKKRTESDPFQDFDSAEALPCSVRMPEERTALSRSRTGRGSGGSTGSMPGAAAIGRLSFPAGPEFSTDEYDPIEEKAASETAVNPVSVFRMTTNTASAGVVFNQLRNGRRIDRNMVRIEEMLNYFRYESEKPVRDMFQISCEMLGIAGGRKYLYVNVQGREEIRESQNIIVLLDVSGSMSGNAEQTQAVVAAIISKLGNGDRLSLVTYSNRDSVELEAVEINGPDDRLHALEKLLSIKIFGGTYGSAGIEKAYQIGRDHYIEGGNNQVILITDGDLNFGITDRGGLEELIENRKKDNIFLSVIGTGLYNYKDDKLETLSKHGNGVYRTVNNLQDVKKSICEEYASLVNIIAKDVKAQVEFNPEVVESWRLLGFENRTLAREDFSNDKVISEPFGSGGYGVALYELTMKEGSGPVGSGLKYSRMITTGSSELCTIKIRYKEPLEDVSHELEKVIDTPTDSCTDNLCLAFVVYVCAEKLRGSDKITAEETEIAKQLYDLLGTRIREINSSDLYKLAGILEKSEAELGIGIRGRQPFPW